MIDAESFDVLRILLTFGADCRLKDKDGNNCECYIRMALFIGETLWNAILYFLQGPLSCMGQLGFYCSLFLIPCLYILTFVSHYLSLSIPQSFIFPPILFILFPFTSTPLFFSPLHHTPLYFPAFHLLAAHGKGFMEMKFAHSITLKAKTQNRNIIDALYYAKNSKKLTPSAVSTYRTFKKICLS
jgi:hypothetical protein